MTEEQAKKLREQFKPEQIGHLPRGGTTLSYVGHAATTDRLLQVDPDWTWEPMAVTETGAPVLVTEGLSPQTNYGIWIKLTIAGVTRPGFGDGKTVKECIGDAIRNAAMRFGVALDLWAKEDLHGDATKTEGEPQAAAPPATTGAVSTPDYGEASSPSSPFTPPNVKGDASDAQRKKIYALKKACQVSDEQLLVSTNGKKVSQLSKQEASELIERLTKYEANLKAGVA